MAAYIDKGQNYYSSCLFCFEIRFRKYQNQLVCTREHFLCLPITHILMVTTELDLRKLIKEYPNFPIQGVLFRDVNPILRNPGALRFMAEEFKKKLDGRKIDLVVGIEARGFIIATAIAILFQIGLILIRKAGKLPGETMRNSYKIEYGSDTIEVQIGALGKDLDILVADDLIATGGTAIASAKILEQAGCRIAGFAFIVELGHLKGARILRDSGYEVNSLVVYD